MKMVMRLSAILPSFYFFMEIGHDQKLEYIQQHKITMYIPDPPTQKL